MNIKKKRFPVEIWLMAALLIICFAGLAIIGFAFEGPEGGMDGRVMFAWILGFFLLSFGMAIIAVIGGIGGGVLFTPFMMAFTPVDSLIIRGTGLIVATFSGLISTGGFMRAGLANLKICIFACVAYGIGAFAGSLGAIVLADRMGDTGDGVVRLLLGFVLFGMVLFFLRGGKKVDWPEISSSDKLTSRLKLSLPYFERSLGRVVDYTLNRAGWFFVIVLGVGVFSGFFGMGAGWAIVPAQNLVLGLPLKVAAANSGVLRGMGDSVAIWPYIHSGAIIPMFVAPWLTGQVFGGLIGTKLLIKVKSDSVRLLLIGFMGFSAYGLLSRGLSGVGFLPEVPLWVTGGVFILIFSTVTVCLFRKAGAKEKV